MLRSIKEQLVRVAVNRCLRAVNEKPIRLRFLTSVDKKAIADLAAGDSVYILNESTVKRYYFYSEPGNPFVCDEFQSLAELSLEIVGSAIRSKITSMSMYFTLTPEKCFLPSAKKYLECNPPGNAHFEKLIASMEIQKHLARHIYQRVDDSMGCLFFRFVDRAVFGQMKRKPDYICNILSGNWIAGNVTRRYDKRWFSSRDASNGEDLASPKRRYKIVSVVGGAAVARFESITQGLDEEERIVVAPDGKSMTIFDNHGRLRYTRSEKEALSQS